MTFAGSALKKTPTVNMMHSDVLASLASVNGYQQQKLSLATESYPGELERLRQQNKQINHVVEVMPTGMIILDGNGVVIKMNKTASQLLDEPILGQPWFDVIKRSFTLREDDWHEVSLNDGRRVKLEITALGDQPGQLIMITDLTETRLLQDKLSQMQRLSSLGRMVAKLAHQIRTPLSAAMLYGANLANKKLKETDRGNFQSKLMSRLKDLEQQVNDMLLFAKSGQQTVVEPLSVNQIISEAKQALEAQIKQANAKVNLNFCPNNALILGNATALSGAIQNLIDNSLSVITVDAEIDIHAYSDCDHVYISVKDNGKGIDASVADKIFEPFYTSRSQGTGLGLAVVKSVMKAHKGEVSLLNNSFEGENKGEGAHFCLKIPKLSNESDNNKCVNKSSNGGAW